MESSEAYLELGHKFMEGLEGAEKSLEKGAWYYLRAVNQGNYLGLFHLANCYLRGSGVPQSNSLAFTCLEYASERGHADSMFTLGLWYEEGFLVSQSNEEAVKYFTKAALRGHLDALYTLGFYHAKGIGFPPSDEEALAYFKMAADRGHVSSIYFLGLYFQKKREFSLAIRYFQMAADRGDCSAMYHLGLCLIHGRGIGKSPEQGLNFLKMSAEGGNTSALKELGMIFLNTDIPHQEALESLTMSAERGNKIAINQLGECYRDGRGVIQSFEKAIELFRRSASQGCLDASQNLSRLQAHGITTNGKSYPLKEITDCVEAMTLDKERKRRGELLESIKIKKDKTL